ncbi:MAG: hypothetical protein Q7J69_02330 [Candidatus Omnitrophota bacterium]|nr:hypothetical protein [Candidatus Omnitrophota bacterium]
MKSVKHSMAALLFSFFFTSFHSSASAETVELVTYFPTSGGGNGGDSQVRSLRVGDDYAAVPAPGDGTAIISDRLGIGTTAPGALLHVEGAAGGTDFFRVSAPGTPSYLTVDPAGNVGIGITAPATLLHVQGLDGNVGGTNSVVSFMPGLDTAAPAGGPATLSVGVGTTNPSSLGGAGALVLHLAGANTAFDSHAFGQLSLSTAFTGGGNTAGAIAFGTTGTAADPERRSAQIRSTLTADSANTVTGDLEFLTNNAGAFLERMRITADGNVGIGTVNPAQRLHVVGTVQIADGTQAAGRVLTSDVNGVASWQAAPGGAFQGIQVGAAQTFNNPGVSNIARTVNLDGFAGATFVQLSSELESLEPAVISSATILYNFRNAANVTILSFPFRLRGGDVDTALDHDSILVPLPANATSIQIQLTGTNVRNRERATLTFYQ